MTSIENTIATLEVKLKQAKAKKQQIEARKRALENKEERAKDTRRKILVGAAILSKVERGEWPKDKLLAILDSALTRSGDRALFNFQKKPDLKIILFYQKQTLLQLAKYKLLLKGDLQLPWPAIVA